MFIIIIKNDPKNHLFIEIQKYKIFSFLTKLFASKFFIEFHRQDKQMFFTHCS